MKRQQGFTLIELIIVIVVLGILAVTAAPQFINFSSDARASTVSGAKGAVQGAMQLVYARSLVDGIENLAAGATGAEVDTEAGTVTTAYGYPTADAAGIGVAAGLDASEWTAATGSGGAATATEPAGTSIGYSPVNATVDYTVTTLDGASCHLVYTQATDTAAASVSVVTGGC